MKKAMCFSGKIVSVRRKTARRAAGSGSAVNRTSGSDTLLDFYLQTSCDSYYLFTQRYTPSVHQMFKEGVRDYELRGFKKWGRNFRVDKTVDKIPVYVAYALREAA